MKKVRTIHDLAELAGVSPATVSRALSGKTNVKRQTFERVKELAELHSFRPSVFARNFRIKRRGAIGVVIPLGHERRQHISDPFFLTIIGHLADELSERGFDLMLSKVIPDSDVWLEEMIAEHRVDGFVLIGQSDQLPILERAAAKYLPIVAWGAYSPGQVHCSVGSDNLMGGKLAAQHLIDVGCKRIAFFGDSRGLEMAQRLEGAKRAVDATNGRVALMEIPTHLVKDVSSEDIVAFLDGVSEPPDGMFAASDVIAASAIQVLSSRGLSVPSDVKVVGYDDLYFAESMMPTLTTVRQDIAKGAQLLVKSLLERIEGDASGSTVLAPKLVVRSSA